jgi:hypothetical protein
MSIVLVGSTSGSVTLQEPAVAGTSVLTLPVGTGTAVVNGVNSAVVSGTAVASTSGTSIDFTSIPSWVKRITVALNGVSTSGTSILQIQIGDSGGIETSGYVGAVGNRASENFYTSGYLINRGFTASSTASGLVILALVSSNIWVVNGTLASSATDAPSFFGGTKTLSDTLTQLRITTVNGTDTFDAGSINILYE